MGVNILFGCLVTTTCYWPSLVPCEPSLSGSNKSKIIHIIFIYIILKRDIFLPELKSVSFGFYGSCLSQTLNWPVSRAVALYGNTSGRRLDASERWTRTQRTRDRPWWWRSRWRWSDSSTRGLELSGMRQLVSYGFYGEVCFFCNVRTVHIQIVSHFKVLHFGKIQKH